MKSIMASLRFKTRITPKHRRDSEEKSVKQRMADQKCTVKLFQVSSQQRDMGKQTLRSRENKVKMSFNGSGDSSSSGINQCPTNLFLSKSYRKDGDIDLLFRHKEIDENFKLSFQTKEMNRLSKDSRIEWLIEAVGGIPTNTNSQEYVNPDRTAYSKKGQSCLHRISRRFHRIVTSIRKLLRRSRVDVLPQKDA